MSNANEKKLTLFDAIDYLIVFGLLILLINVYASLALKDYKEAVITFSLWKLTLGEFIKKLDSKWLLIKETASKSNNHDMQ